MVLCLGVHPNECVKDRSQAVDRYTTKVVFPAKGACRTWRFVLIQQMAQQNLSTLCVLCLVIHAYMVSYCNAVCTVHVRCALALRIAEFLAPLLVIYFVCDVDIQGA